MEDFTINNPYADEATFSITSTVKTPHPRIIVVCHPIVSARLPLISAPKNVPADNIDTISDCFDAGMAKSVAAVAGGYGNPPKV